MVPMAQGSRLRPWRSRSMALLAALLTSSAVLALDLPGARPGSTLHIEVPRRDGVAEAPAPEAPKAAEIVSPESAPKSAEAKPADVKPAETKTDETKTAASAPVEVKPEAVAAVPGGVDEAAIRAFLEPKKAKYRLKPEEISGFVAAYAARSGKPYFVEERDGALRISAKVEALVRTVQAADAEGLDSARLMAVLPQRRSGALEVAQRAEAELSSAFAAFLYARDARGGRIEPARVSALTTPTLYLPAPAEVLEALGKVSDAGVPAVLEAYQPQHPGFKRLKAELARLNEPVTPVITANVASALGAPTPEASLPPDFMAGGPLRLGEADPRVPNLRIRLNMPGSASNLFDADVKAALIAFQSANGLTANGWLTPRTRAALENRNTPISAEAAPNDRRAQKTGVLVNMERWRWLPPDLGARHVFVNIPAYELRLMDNGAVVHEARVIVGKPETQTPIFSDTFAHVIVNPSWFVPPSIIKKEFLPRLASDPSYAARRGFEVVQTRSGLSVRQPPGERNALGHVKFIFPNRHSVYLHDTPSRGLFANDTRAFSHGCVRVDKPFALAEKLLSQSGGFSEPQLRGMVGRGERMIKMADKVNVHLSYFTLAVDDAGTLHRYRDLYGHDARLKAALAL